MKTLNIIGAGKVGKVLGYLFQQKKCFKVQCILNKTKASTEAARDFIGGGTVVLDFAHLLPADVYLLCVPDDTIATVCEHLVAEHTLPKNAFVFHCSGALSAAQLIAAQRVGACIASAHPVFSFSDPEHAVNALEGVTCTLEGDTDACQMLADIFTTIGMKIFEIAAKDKLVYHASIVMAVNYSVALMAAAVTGLNQVGISEDNALNMLRPMVMDAMVQLFAKGPLQALTGPIIRGDHQLVTQEIQTLSACNPRLASLYSELANYTMSLLRPSRRR